MDFLEILKVIFLGIVEGITEWLPISSTGHMLLVDEFITLNAVDDEFKEMFFVVIQLGAILAVPTLFFERLNPFSRKKTKDEKKGTIDLWCKVIVGAVPAAFAGLILDDFLDEHLYTSTSTGDYDYGQEYICSDFDNASDLIFALRKVMGE